MRALLSFCPPEVLDWNSIELHDVDGGARRSRLLPRRLLLCDLCRGRSAPAAALSRSSRTARTARGSTIGGTGLGISAHCAASGGGARTMPASPPADDAARLRPASRPAGPDRGLARRRDRRALRRLLQRHPRDDGRHAGSGRAIAGYLGFQAKAATLVERHLRGDICPTASYLSTCKGTFETLRQTRSMSAQPPRQLCRRFAHLGDEALAVRLVQAMLRRHHADRRDAAAGGSR